MKLSKYLLIFLILSTVFSQKYDPKTGELIEQQKYDPITGEPIKTTKYDPITGEPIEDISAPNSNKSLPATSSVNVGDNVSITTIEGVVFKGVVKAQNMDQVVLSSPSIGEIKITRSNIKRISGYNESGLIHTTNIKSSDTKINSSLNSPNYLSIINAAKEEANQKNQKDTATNVGAGVAGCLFGLVGMPLASLYALSDTSGEPKSNYYNELSSQNKNIYKSAYKAEVNKKKQTSVFGTMGAGLVVVIFITLMAGP